jgi:hypothetical protein
MAKQKRMSAVVGSNEEDQNVKTKQTTQPKYLNSLVEGYKIEKPQ